MTEFAPTAPRGGAPGLSRRRVITIIALAAGLAVAPGLPRRRARAGTAYRWSGRALGAETEIILHHADRAAAQRLIALCRDEIERLEKEFSLYRGDSALVHLNRRGTLANPSLDMRRLLAECRRFGDLAGGAFDVTVQPLWELYACHFAGPDADPAGPAPGEIEKALAVVDYRAVRVGPGRVVLERPGMALTLNGIAQGYITDRVADLLRAGGVTSVLIDLGEIRALGSNAGRPWRVGIRDPMEPSRVRETLPLVDCAIATSAGSGTRFDAAGSHHHLFDPHRGVSSRYYAGVSVIAPRATEADALSTALYAMPPAAAAKLVGRLRGVGAILTLADGRSIRLAA